MKKILTIMVTLIMMGCTNNYSKKDLRETKIERSAFGEHDLLKNYIAGEGVIYTIFNEDDKDLIGVAKVDISGMSDEEYYNMTADLKEYGISSEEGDILFSTTFENNVTSYSGFTRRDNDFFMFMGKPEVGSFEEFKEWVKVTMYKYDNIVE